MTRTPGPHPRHTRGAREAACLLLLLLALCGALPGACAEAADLAVRQVVRDIVSFTRWPAPRAELRLCVVGQPAHAAALLEPAAADGAVPLQGRRMSWSDERLGAACDVVYAGALAAEERFALNTRLAGHAVLTVGEQSPGCLEAMMFCLQAGGAQVPFGSNLDAIARGGVKLNPRVLLLSRRARAEPPR